MRLWYTRNICLYGLIIIGEAFKRVLGVIFSTSLIGLYGTLLLNLLISPSGEDIIISLHDIIGPLIF